MESLARVGPAEQASGAAGGAGDGQDANSLDSVDLTGVFHLSYPFPRRYQTEMPPTGLHNRKCTPFGGKPGWNRAWELGGLLYDGG